MEGGTQADLPGGIPARVSGKRLTIKRRAPLGEPGQFRNLVYIALLGKREVAKEFTKYDLKRKLKAMGYDVDGL
jgi:hypothetical protein